MTEGRYRLVFRGEIAADADRLTVQEKVCKLLKVDGARGEALFSGQEVVLKDGLTHADAARFRALFEKTGAVASVKAVRDAVPEVVTICCPKCGLEQEESATCSRCGIDFARHATLAARQKEKEKADALAARMREREQELYGSTSKATAAFIELGLLLILALIIISQYNLKYHERFSPPGGDFSVNFPGYPTKSASKGKKSGTDSMFVYKSGKCEYYVAHNHYDREAPPQEVLENIAASLRRRANVIGEEDTSIGDHVAKKIHFQMKGEGTVRVLISPVGPDLYQVGVTTEGEDTGPGDSDRFMQSFHLNKPAPATGSGDPAASPGA